MDRLLQWAWDRHAPRYSWVIFAVTFVAILPQYLLVTFLVVVHEESHRYVEAAAASVLAVLLQVHLMILPGRIVRLSERWARGEDVDPAQALEETYTRMRGIFGRSVAIGLVVLGLTLIVVATISGASASRIIQYGILGAVLGASVVLGSFHGFTEGAMRPVRVALAGDTPIGDALPRLRPSFVAWSNLFVLVAVFNFCVASALVAAVFATAVAAPVLALVVGLTLMLAFGVPIAVASNFSQSLGPIRDLAEGTKRVSAGDYSRRLPVVQDDDLGALAASFNRMQAGLAERERLQAAFGSYVDPALAARLLEQGDDIFTGERREVTVMFVDIRDFTPFAEANTAEETVSHLNALFEIVVPAVLDAGGHVNKYLGDGALAVFGAPNTLDHHADAALNAAIQIRDHVAEHFHSRIRIGIGINTGPVIAGTIGGAGKLEFTLIGDTVNVASRIEQLTKATGDTILLTDDTLKALRDRPSSLADRGNHDVKGKSAPVAVYGFDDG